LVTATVIRSDGTLATRLIHTGGRSGFVLSILFKQDLATFLSGKNADDIQNVMSSIMRHCMADSPTVDVLGLIADRG